MAAFDFSSMFFFDSWTGLLRVCVVGTLAYLALIVILRLSGKRTLSKLNIFDFIVTIALGSTLATVMISKDVPLAEGLLAFAVLIMLQFAVTWTSVRSAKIRQIVRAEPRLLLHRGVFLESAMRIERVTESEVMQAIRSAGVGSLELVAAVIMQTDGTMAVIQGVEGNHESTLQEFNQRQPYQSSAILHAPGRDDYEPQCHE